MSSKKNSVIETNIAQKQEMKPCPENKISKLLNQAIIYKPKGEIKMPSEKCCGLQLFIQYKAGKVKHQSKPVVSGKKKMLEKG